jgi:hypothetical protein
MFLRDYALSRSHAGSGKSTTARECIRHIQHPDRPPAYVLYVAYNTKLIAEAKAVLLATPGIEAVVTKTLNACALELVARYYNRPKRDLIVETPVATLDSVAQMLEVSKLVKSKVPEVVQIESRLLALVIKHTITYFMHSADARVLDKHVPKKLQEHNTKTGTCYNKADIIYLTQQWFDTAVEAMKSRDQSVLFTHDMCVKLAVDEGR